MIMMMVQIAGRLGKDAETRFTASGQKVTTLTLATNVRKGGKEETAWWRITVWGDRFDKMFPYWKKGSALIVVGEMNKPEIWTDKEGRPQVGLEMTADIIRFNPFGSSSPQEGGGLQNQASQNQTTNGNAAGYAASGNYAMENSNSYGMQHAGDFGGAAQGASSSYSQANHSDDHLPF
jgi:single-strand DNA-binding protein